MQDGRNGSKKENVSLYCYVSSASNNQTMLSNPSSHFHFSSLEVLDLSSFLEKEIPILNIQKLNAVEQTGQLGI